MQFMSILGRILTPLPKRRHFSTADGLDRGVMILPVLVRLNPGFEIGLDCGADVDELPSGLDLQVLAVMPDDHVART